MKDPQEFERIEDFFFENMEQASKLVAMLDSVCRRYDITPQQWFVLQLLLRGPAEGLKVSQIGNRMHVTKGNVTGILNRMEKKELIERIGSRIDRRVTFIKITRRGKTTVNGVSKYLRTMGQTFGNKVLMPVLDEGKSNTLGSLDGILNGNSSQRKRTITES